MDTFTLNFHPAESTINSFLPNLKKEYEETGHGMYCNWDVIKKRQKKDQIITLRYNNVDIAFVTWYRIDKVVEMEIIWTSPTFRGHGFGLIFQELLFKEFKKRGDVALTLFCASKDGLSLARRSGFQPQYNRCDFSNESIELGLTAAYIKILRNTEPLLMDNNDSYILCFEEYGKDDSLFCEIPLCADYEQTPVYYYVDESWECKIIYKGELIRQSKLEYILRDLKIGVYNYTVALFDKNIVLPNHWLK